MRIKVEMVSPIDIPAFVKNNVYSPAVAALNEVAKTVVKDLKVESAKDFDRPTPFTQRAFVVAAAANTDQKDPFVVVAALPQQSKYLGLEIFGGERKAGDYATSKHGLVMPGPDVELNDYGNLPRGYLAALIARKQSFTQPGKNGAILIFARYGRDAGMDHNAKRLVAVINKHATYKPRFKFFETIIDTVNRELPGAFNKVLRRRVGRTR